MNSSERGRNRILLIAVGLAVLCLVAYWNTLHGEFQFDDERLILLNYSLQDLTHWRRILLFEPFRPVLLLTFALNYEIGGRDPFSYHVGNVALHAGNSVLFFLLLLRFRMAGRDACPTDAGGNSAHLLYSALAAALFAVHPLNTEAVSYISGRSIVLCAFFYLLSLLFFDSYLRKGRWVDLLLFTIPLSLGLFTKEEAAMIPVAVLLYNLFFFGTESVKKHRSLHAVLIVMVVSAAVFRLYAEWKYAGLSLSSFPVYITTEIFIWLRYFWLAAYPIPLNVDHEIAPLSFSSPAFWLSLTVVASLFWLLWNFRRAQPVFVFWGWWFFMNVLPSSVIPLPDFMAEHRVYISMFGFCGALGYLVLLFPKREDTHSRILSFVLVFLVLFFTAATIHRNRVWADQLSLWYDTVQKSPGKARPHINLGYALYLRKAYDEAIQEYFIALSIKPDLPLIYNGLGLCFLKKNDFKQAEQSFDEALRIDPSYADAKTGKGLIRFRQGRYNEALSYFQQSYAKRYGSAQLNALLGICYLRTGQAQKAAELINGTIHLHPKLQQAGEAMQKGELQTAERILEELTNWSQ